MNKKLIMIIASTILCGMVLYLVCSTHVLKHGFYPEEIDVGQIADVDKLGHINVNDEKCKVVFSPKNDLFAGLELYLVDHVPENGGTMTVKIADPNGRQIDKIEIDLKKVKDSVWYKVYTNANLFHGKQYSITFDVANTEWIPSFVLINPDYLKDENIEGNVLISYAYSHPTFSSQEKVMIVMLIFALLGIVLYCAIPNQRYRSFSKPAILFLVLTTGLSWNYMYNSIDNQNTTFPTFQNDSETFVTGMIYAEREGTHFLREEENGYGLGRYIDLKGALMGYDSSYLTDNNWLDGYNRAIPAIVVNSNDITKKIAVSGNTIRFKNGEEYLITETIDDGTYIAVHLAADRNLSRARNGSLDDCNFFGTNHQVLEKSTIASYQSQFGLQGKVFRHMAHYMDKEETIANLYLVCSLATASVFVLIVLLLKIKYNALFAGCFYIVFFLSPWVVNFARNLYWVEFTWFIPMAVGILCAIKAESRKWRIGCYLAAFISIVVKCLCGYEYLTAVMMGLISFIVVDLLTAIAMKHRNRAKLLFRTTFIMGIIALLGFIVAISIHATLRGSGSIVEGIKQIFKYDVLKRTSGADLNDFDPIFWPSMNASVWEVIRLYFHFSTEVITGIPGNLFSILCIAPIVIFVIRVMKKQYCFQSISMYVFFFLTAVLWFCLAKSHSYIHTHINYVLWYFGFVQTCIYVVVSNISDYFRKVNSESILSDSTNIDEKNKR